MSPTETRSSHISQDRDALEEELSDATPPSVGRVVARLLTELLAPAPVAGFLLVIVAWHSATPGSAEAVRSALIAVLFAVLVPTAFVLRQVRRQRLSDRHVRQREQRRLPLLVAILSVLLGLGVLVLGQAPRALVALVAAMAVGLVAALLVTLAWKISIHVAVVAGAVTILALVFGPAALFLAPLVVVVGWARIALHDHTPAQTAAGAALGALVAAAVFSVAR